MDSGFRIPVSDSGFRFPAPDSGFRFPAFRVARFFVVVVVFVFFFRKAGEFQNAGVVKEP